MQNENIVIDGLQFICRINLENDDIELLVPCEVRKGNSVCFSARKLI